VEVAREAGVIVLESDRIRLEHPLLGSVVYADAPPGQRRDVHRCLAGIVRNPEDRARHLAIAADGPDETVAAALELAAGDARARGASQTAAELAELAAELTPGEETEATARRRALAGDAWFEAGDARQAQRLLEEVLRSTPRGPGRARLLWRLGTVKAAAEGPPAAVELYVAALEETEQDRRLHANLQERLATWRWVAEGPLAAEPHARALLEVAEEVGEPGLVARALGTLLFVEVGLGRGLDRERYDRMIALEQSAGEQGVELPGSALHVQILTWAGEYDEARVRIGALVDRARARGDAARIVPEYCLAFLDMRTANWQRSLDKCEELLELAEQTGRDALVPMLLILRAFAGAYLGNVEAARADAVEGGRQAEATGQGTQATISPVPQGLAALSLGEADSAYEIFARLADEQSRRGEAGSAVFWLPDEVEARVACGDLDAAESRLDPFEAHGRERDLPWMLAASARCRGLITFARGDGEAALAQFDRALGEHERYNNRYEVGRTLLARGTVQRRLRQNAAASESLARARGLFEEVSARQWSHRATEELGHIGGRARRTGGLTPTEERVAALVAAGKSNHQVARALHVSPKTVEWNLSKIYRKLRVSSRTELAAKRASRP
jgi:DNA-binding CsgD family transcriptional regulator